jgi:hypothetical protein
MRYKLLSTRFARYENGRLVRFEPGDVVDLTPEEADRFAGGRIEAVVVAVPDPVEPPTCVPTHELVARDAIAEIKVETDEDALLAVYAAEDAGRQRVSVLNAITDRLASLEDE